MTERWRWWGRRWGWRELRWVLMWREGGSGFDSDFEEQMGNNRKDGRWMGQCSSSASCFFSSGLLHKRQIGLAETIQENLSRFRGPDLESPTYLKSGRNGGWEAILRYERIMCCKRRVMECQWATPFAFEMQRRMRRDTSYGYKLQFLEASSRNSNLQRREVEENKICSREI